jgi:hypothetical protein
MQMSLASTSSSENVAAKLILHQDCARFSMIRDNLLGLCPNFFLKAVLQENLCVDVSCINFESWVPPIIVCHMPSCRDRGRVDVVWGRLRCPGPFSIQHPIVSRTLCCENIKIAVNSTLFRELGVTACILTVQGKGNKNYGQLSI